jgi:hypothetical protein
MRRFFLPAQAGFPLSRERRCQLVTDAVADENREALALTSILSQDGRGSFREFHLRGKTMQRIYQKGRGIKPRPFSFAG